MKNFIEFDTDEKGITTRFNLQWCRYVYPTYCDLNLNDMVLLTTALIYLLQLYFMYLLLQHYSFF